MKYLLLLLSIMLCQVAQAGYTLQDSDMRLIVNGVECGTSVDLTATRSGGSREIRLSGAVSCPGGDPDPDPDPIPDPPDDPPSNCSRSSFNYTGNGDIDCRLWGNWGEPTGTVRLRLNSKPLIMPFVATNDSSLTGRLDLVMDGSAGQRQMWISRSPGGAPLNQLFLGKDNCSKSGAEISLNWEQSNSTANICSLAPGTTYFVNLTHTDCNTSSCGSKWRNQ